MPVLHADFAFNSRKPKLVGRTVHRATFDATACEPAAHCIFVVIAARLEDVLVARKLGDRQAPHLATPNNKRVVE